MADPVLIENINFNTEYEEIISLFRTESPEYTNFTDSDPLMHMLAVCAGKGVELKSFINLAIRQYFIDTATGIWLDQIGAGKNVPRLVLVEADPNSVPPTAAILESDDAYRLRIKNAPPNNAATAAEYEYFATQFSANVKSARAYKPNPNSSIVNVAIISNDNNGVASPSLISGLQTYLNDRTRRAIGDTIVVVGATSSLVNVTATITLLQGASVSIFNDLPTTFANALNAINTLGRDITTSWIIKALSPEGVYKVQLTAPTADIIVGDTGFARLGTLNLTLAPTSGF